MQIVDNIKQKQNIINFVNRWKDTNLHTLKEKEDTQAFWLELLRIILGVEFPAEFIKFNKRLQKTEKLSDSKVRKTSLEYDAFIPKTHVLIEQKSKGIKLDESYLQSDGKSRTPFEQADNYNNTLGRDEKARWIVVSNFEEIRIHDMNKPKNRESEFETVLLKDLEDEWINLQFLVADDDIQAFRSTQISLDAGNVIGTLYKALEEKYKGVNGIDYINLNKLCVRLVFCFYAEDSGLFGNAYNEFYTFIEKKRQSSAGDVRNGLRDLFTVLNTEEKDRDKGDTSLASQFPYVNGGLFDDKDTEFNLPSFDDKIVKTILDTSKNFNWALVNPTIFGAVFESTLNQETRRHGGMHFTSIENIHRVIDPLFLNDLKAEFEKAKSSKALLHLQDKLSSLTFLDPACGSGNFLTETYLELRKLENKILRKLSKDTMYFGGGGLNPIKVTINQFFGIEINDFAVNVAKTALWIAENQMKLETASIVQNPLEFLPLSENKNIREANALRIDWNDIVQAKDLTYIIGNPPFSGARVMQEGSTQKEDVALVFGNKWKNAGNLDYVSCWFKKCSDYMQGTDIKAALVATNSVSQGDLVSTLWKPLLDKTIYFDFAYRSFRWDSESNNKAQVHCVIIGFSAKPSNSKKTIFIEKNVLDESIKDKKGKPTKKIVLEKQTAKRINAYLWDTENYFVETRSHPICDVPEIGIGNQPIDKQNYLFTKEKMDEFLQEEPKAEKYFHKWYGADEFLYNQPRYCLWLGDVKPEILDTLPKCKERIKAVREFRLKSNRKSTVRLADTPTRFQVENMPKGNYLLIPRVSSENRLYIPVGFMTPDCMCSDAVHIIPNATLYHFAVLSSSIHMAWVKAIAGRLETRYRYSKDIVYNNFIWCNPTQEQKAKIEHTAQAILDIRNKYSSKNLANLYGENLELLYTDLLKVHKENDKAVMSAYGFKEGMSESEIVDRLFKLYKAKVES